MTKILTREEAQNRPYYYFYDNNDYAYETKDGYYHLIRDGVDLLEGKMAVYCMSYDDNNYAYRTEDGDWHLFPKKDCKTSNPNELNHIKQ